MAPLPDAIAVVGGGRMGVGIAQAFAVAGTAVTIAEADDNAAQAARQRVERGLHRAAKKGQFEGSPAAVLSRMHTVTSVTDLPANAGLVVDTVPALLDQKFALLAAIEKVVTPTAVLASNTDSLSITAVAAALTRPERFLGMQFFKPVPTSGVVEVVRAPETEGSTVKAVLDWVNALGKCEVLVRNSPGFATSRLGVVLGLEAIRMLEEGLDDADSIDHAMELRYHHPIGPLRSTDLIGLDVRLAIAEYLHAALGGRFTPPQLLRDKVARGELGRKSGQGFYPWPVQPVSSYPLKGHL